MNQWRQDGVVVMLAELLGEKHRIRARVHVVEHAVVGRHPTGQTGAELDLHVFEGFLVLPSDVSGSQNSLAIVHQVDDKRAKRDDLFDLGCNDSERVGTGQRIADSL